MTFAPPLQLALAAGPLDVSPTWTSINAAGIEITSWRVDRGRSYELDKVGTGVATITGIDHSGALDPTNSTGPYYGSLDPMKQARLRLTNPVGAGTATSTIFQGHVSEFRYDVDVSQTYQQFEIDLVDIMDFIAAVEVVPGNAGTTVPAGSEGNAFYAAQQVDDRIKAALADASIPTGMQEIFSGAVAVQDTVYAPRSQILSVIQDAADAEFPGVANFYIARDGTVIFHGRNARFDPSLYYAGGFYAPGHPITPRKAGDRTAAAGDSSYALISGFKFARSKDTLINACLSTPQNIDGTAIAGQLDSDVTSIGNYGLRSLSFENLLTLSGDEVGTPDANGETFKFATYYKDNMAEPRNRISQITFRPQPPATSAGTATWALICGVELTDVITVNTKTVAGGSGEFNEDFFVEGIHYEVTPMRNSYPEITLTLDLSPTAYYTTDPFS